MKYTFIINPKSRSGKGLVLWNLLKPELKKRQIACEVFYTEYAGHATKIAEEVTADGKEHTLVVMGGDGSICEVLTGIKDCSKVILGYIPTGSGNDFTREMKLPTDPREAFELVLNPGRIALMDVGAVRNGEKIWRFGVSTGIGYDAAVCHNVEKSKLKSVLNKIHLGHLAYLGVALRRLFKNPSYEMDLELDEGERMHFHNVYFVAAMNQPYEGGGFRFCPDAKTDDGALDVIVVSNLPRLKVLALLPTAFWGKHVRFKGVDVFRCKKIVIHANAKAAIHADGQPIAVEQVLEAEVIPQQLRVILPE